MPRPRAPSAADEAAVLRWLDRHREGVAAADALAYFDRLPAVDLDGLLGRWHGAELPTGSPMDGLLAAHGWYGKEIADPDTVHPLLFCDRAGVPHPVDPALVPLAFIRRYPWLARGRPARAASAVARPLLRTGRPAARARLLVHRGVSTGALVYDRLPVLDVFRRVTADVLLGLMDLRGLPEPFFFVLRRDAGR